MDKDIKNLRSRVLFTRMALLILLVAGLLFVVLYFRPDWTSLPAGTEGTPRGDLIILFTGILFTAAGAAGFAFIGRWKNELIRVYKREIPNRMQVKIEVEESSDSTDYFAAIRELEPDAPVSWRVQLFVSPDEIPDKLMNNFCNARVYFDPNQERPMLIQTEYGIFWTMGGSGAAQRK